ncbi:MAG: hypothetical protein KGJ57_17030 [Sphingomonadales bacterium]|nr:hypothetical protein [Sphingomonadales bacterium]
MIRLAGHDWNEATSVIICNHVAAGSEVRTVHVDPDGLCFQCGSPDDDIDLAKVFCLDCVIDRPGLNDLPEIPVNWVAYREADGSWTIEEQAED